MRILLPVLGLLSAGPAFAAAASAPPDLVVSPRRPWHADTSKAEGYGLQIAAADQVATADFPTGLKDRGFARMSLARQGIIDATWQSRKGYRPVASCSLMALDPDIQLRITVTTAGGAPVVQSLTLVPGPVREIEVTGAASAGAGTDSISIHGRPAAPAKGSYLWFGCKIRRIRN